MASGYLLATRFDVLYDTAVESGRFDDHPAITKPIYGIPHRSRPLPDGIPHYRGIDREPLLALGLELARILTEGGMPSEPSAATVLLDEIEIATGREDGWVTEKEAIGRVWEALGPEQRTYEVIFGKEYDDPADPPQDAEFLGCDVAYFVSDHFSCICDALFIPRWHGTDSEGTLFCRHFDRLNEHGLFKSNEAALDYLRYYLSFDWTERDDNFTSIEVYAVTPGVG